jgi:hypothetical protein
LIGGVDHVVEQLTKTSEVSKPFRFESAVLNVPRNGSFELEREVHRGLVFNLNPIAKSCVQIVHFFHADGTVKCDAVKCKVPACVDTVDTHTQVVLSSLLNSATRADTSLTDVSSKIPRHGQWKIDF